MPHRGTVVRCTVEGDAAGQLPWQIGRKPVTTEFLETALVFAALGAKLALAEP